VRNLLAATRPRLSSLALAAAVFLAFVGLFAADRMLATTRRIEAESSAAESAALVEGFLRVHAQALQSVRGLYLDTTRTARAEHFQALVDVLHEHASAFRRIWMTDSAGVIRQERLFGPPSLGLPRPLDIDTAGLLDLRAAARAARQTRRTQMTRPGPIFTGEHGFALVEPIVVGRQFKGFAGGTVTVEALLASINARGARPYLRHIVLAGRDTLAADAPVGEIAGLRVSAPQPIRTPDGGQWTLVVVYEPTWVRRLVLWAVGLVILAALLVALIHERRQGTRLAERSAELERLSTELLRANRAKSEFLANVSHELRTPLNAIVGFVDLLRDGVYGELAPRQVNPVERIAASAAHLRHLVDQVLDIAKMAAGRLEVHPEPVDVRAMVLNVASEVEALITERSLNLSIAVGTTLPRLRTDPTHLRQILLNLLGNAIKFTRSGGIAIRARLVDGRDMPALPAGRTAGRAPPRGGRDDGRWIALQVADTGIGIPRDDLERIFDEFEQVNAGPRGDSMQRGTGLGLPISRRLARLLGGDISVDSELGKGSSFTIWLPVDPADVRAAGEPRAEEAAVV
jgi:signal transduction histidine kinase